MTTYEVIISVLFWGMITGGALSMAIAVACSVLELGSWLYRHIKWHRQAREDAEGDGVYGMVPPIQAGAANDHGTTRARVGIPPLPRVHGRARGAGGGAMITRRSSPEVQQCQITSGAEMRMVATLDVSQEPLCIARVQVLVCGLLRGEAEIRVQRPEPELEPEPEGG